MKIKVREAKPKQKKVDGFPVVEIGGTTWMVNEIGGEVDNVPAAGDCLEDSDGAWYYNATYAKAIADDLKNGWRIPTKEDWLKLCESLGGSVNTANGSATGVKWAKSPIKLLLNGYYTARDNDFEAVDVNKGGFFWCSSNNRSIPSECFIIDGSDGYTLFEEELEFATLILVKD